MKMVKSLLLGSAAGLVAVTAGQAADLPVKAKPVEYVKICSLYGAGFYYMPGTDLCLKIGGFIRAEETSGGTNGSLAWGPFNGNVNDRITNNLTVRARGYITADAREQSAYGTIRGYIAVGLNTSDIGTAASEAPGGTYANRGFVQWAGMTAGLSRSMFDGYNAAALNYRAGFIPTEDSGDGGWWIWAYTAQFGNGFSATFSSEARRMNQIIGATNLAATAAVAAATAQPAFFPANTAAFIGGGSIGASASGSGYGGWQVPDFVGNLRVDQAWGSAQVMGAAHEVNPTYYSSTTAATCGVFVASATPSYETCGGPGVEWGWVVGAWTHINFPMIAHGDYLEVEANYTEGALKYLYNGEDSNMEHANGSTQGYGVAADCVYGGTIASGTASSCHLTTGWNVDAGFEHYWTPQWHQSVAGGYINVKYDAAANAMLCSDAGNGNGLAGTAAVGAAGCNNNWSYWGVGTRLQWDVTKTFYLGVEVLYNQLESAHTSDGLIHGYGLLAPAAPIFVGNQSNWAFTIRAHRDFLP